MNLGIHTIKRKLASGEVREFRYHRLSRARIYSEPGTPEFDDELRLIGEGRKSKAGRRVLAQRKAAPQVSTHLYAVLAPVSGLIKLGRAKDVGRRLSVLQTGCPELLTLLGSAPDTSGGLLERRLHRDLAEHRVRGEWFADNPAVRTRLRRIKTFIWNGGA